MDNLSIAIALHEIADLLELRGDSPYKARAYRGAAAALEALPEEAATLVARGGLLKVHGIGQSTAEKIVELLATGRCAYLDEVREAVPPGLRELVAVPGLGATTAALLYSRMGIASLDDLELAARQGRLRDLPGFSPRKEQAILQKLPGVRAHQTRAAIAALAPLAYAIAAALRGHPAVVQAEVAGGLRRQCDTVGDADIVVATERPDAVLDAVAALPLVRKVSDRRPGALSVQTSLGWQVEVFTCAPASFGAALVQATGSAAHLDQLAARAGGRIPLGAAAPFATEEALYAALGLAWIPPELREGAGEIAVAAGGVTPRLVTEADLRGDLHCHTSASDGTATVPEMAQAAADLGYAYLAITDHSPLLKITRGLDPERLARHAAEIRRLGQVGQTRLLVGCEVDILADGRLDQPPEALERLDVVVASVHMRYSQDGPAMTERICRALRTGRVHILGHPTGRLVQRRDPFDVDLDQVFAVAAEHGVALEMSADPHRLDLRAELAKRARAAGCRLAIGTDAHSAPALAERSWGIGQARRAGLAPADIINCLDLPALAQWLQPRP